MLVLSLNAARTDGGDRLHFLAANAPAVTLRLLTTTLGGRATFDVTDAAGVREVTFTDGPDLAPLPGVPGGRLLVRVVSRDRVQVVMDLPKAVQVYRGSMLRQPAGA